MAPKGTRAVTIGRGEGEKEEEERGGGGGKEP